jgi:hypothetical protein
MAERRADRVELHFTVPAANTDGTRPANIERIDIYAVTSPDPVPAEQLVKAGRPIASVPVKGPRDPNDVIGPDDADDDLEPLEGNGLDQGIRTSVVEGLTSDIVSGPSDETLKRFYVAVGVSRAGRRGPISPALPVRLAAAPSAPGRPTVTYSETRIDLAWAGIEKPAAVGYNVYEIASETTARSEAEGSKARTRLTSEPVKEPQFVDTRIEWGIERCYTVRAVETTDGLSIEGDESASICVTLRDTFPPAAPVGLETGSSPGAISLVWDPNKEKDLAGYHVLRGEPGAATLTRLGTNPIQETSYTDMVPAGTRYVYAIEAVDTANNVSQPSERKEEAAR